MLATGAPTEISFYLDQNEILKDASIELEEAMRVSVRCVTGGGNPAPTLRLLGKSASGVVMDLTSKVEVADDGPALVVTVSVFDVTSCCRRVLIEIYSIHSLYRSVHVLA